MGEAWELWWGGGAHLTCAINLLTGEVEYCQSRESLGSWLSLERLMMKSSTLFEHGPQAPTLWNANIARRREHDIIRKGPEFREQEGNI